MYRQISSAITALSRLGIVPKVPITTFQSLQFDFVSRYSSKVISPPPPSIRIQTADRAKHYDQCYNIMLNEFVKHEPLARYLGPSENYAALLKDVLDQSIDQPWNLMSFDGDKMIGLYTNYVVDYNPPVPKNVKMPLEPNFDLTKSIKNASYKNACENTFKAVLDEVEREYTRFIPGCKRLLKSNFVLVKPEYQTSRIGSQLVQRTLELARKEKCDYVVAVFSAVASTKIGRRQGFNFVKTLPLEKFHANGRPLFAFPRFHDGNDALRLGVLDLRKKKERKQ